MFPASLQRTFSDIQMVIKRRSLSTVSAISVLGGNAEKLANVTMGSGTYRHFTDMSPSSLPASPEIPKKSAGTRLFLKKANVYNFIRKRPKTEAMRNSLSTTDLTATEKCLPPRPESDTNGGLTSVPATNVVKQQPANVQMEKIENNTSGYIVYLSFSFGVDKYLKRPVATHKKFLSSKPKSVYRCLIYSADWALGSAYKLIGSTEYVSLSAEDSNLQFSFISPIGIHYDYALDTNLRFELQCARASSSSSMDKWFTTTAVTPSFETSTLATMTNGQRGGGESIDKAVTKRWRPAESSVAAGDLLPGTSSLKFLTIATSCCDLNGLVNRGFLKADMKMRSDLAAPAVMYLGTEPSLANVKLRNNEPWTLAVKFNARQRQDANNALLFSATTPYRLLISRFFNQANAFISIYKSASFLLSFSNSHFSVEIDKIQLSSMHFLKNDSLFRFAFIDASTEKWICFANVQGSLLRSAQPMFEVPITECANVSKSTINTAVTDLPSQRSSLRASKSFNMGVFRIWSHHNVHNPFRSSVTESASLTSTSTSSCGPSSSMRSSSVSNASKPSVSVMRSESFRDSRSSGSVDNRSNSSGYSYSAASSQNHCIYDDGLENVEQDEDTMIVTGHTQAYLMSLLVPNKRILVREIYPSHVRICERRC